MTETSIPESAFDAIVAGEYERAFTGTRFATLYTWCTRHGIQLWLPETSGPVDLGDRDHRALMSLPATQSQREVLRARHRVLAAMHNQATQQGRNLGGGPPYGYQLVDAGPHPNPADSRTTPHVAWTFQQRLAGTASPASPDTSTNAASRARPSPTWTATATRTRGGWTLRTVAVILANPR